MTKHLKGSSEPIGFENASNSFSIKSIVSIDIDTDVDTDIDADTDTDTDIDTDTDTRTDIGQHTV